MPFLIFKKLGLGELNPTMVIRGRSIKHPKEIIEDVQVKVDKFIFLGDFIVLDMKEDEKIPLILERELFLPWKEF